MSNIKFDEAWVKLLKSIKKSNSEGNKSKMQLWRDTGISYYYILELVNEMQKIGLIHCEKNGREIQTILTKKGIELKEKILNIEAIIATH